MWRHAGLVAFMLVRHPVMPDGDFGTVFVCDFADVCSFDAVWVRRAGVVARRMRVPGWCCSLFAVSWLTVRLFIYLLII